MNSQQLLNLSYEQKVNHAKQMIRDFYHLCEYNTPYISFSGGKDSVVLAHLVHDFNRDIPLQTSAEQFHPEIIPILRHYNSEIIPSKYNLGDFIDKFGLVAFGKKITQELHCLNSSHKFRNTETERRRMDYIYKRYPKYCKMPIQLINSFTGKNCCDYVKGNLKNDPRPSFVGTTVYESDIRMTHGKSKGCIVGNKSTKKCMPISIFTEADIGRYIHENHLVYSKAYDMGGKRTGCLCCPMGIQFKARRQELLLVKKYYPMIYKEFYKRFEKLIKYFEGKELYD